MKFSILAIFLVTVISCISKKRSDKGSFEFEKYELAYDSITQKMNSEKPFLNEFKSDASGVKIIPKIFLINNYSIYGSEYFKNENSFENNGIKKLSKKYAKPNWRNDNEYRILEINELKNFHGPLKYIYFSEIRNDSLRAEILWNPFTEYSMTHREHYLIIFENKKVKLIEKTVGDYD